MRFFKYPVAFLLVAFFMLLLTIVWYSRSSYQSFVESHQQLALRSVDGTARELEFLVREYQRLMNLFITREKSLLRKLILDPGDSSSNQELRSKVDVYFPERFAFTVADKNGIPILTKGRELIGKACSRDIKGFSRAPHRHAVYVHPSPTVNKFHFDLMNSITESDEPVYVFFVSFFLNDLVRVMNHGKIVGHELILVKRDTPDIIEATTYDAQSILFSGSRHPEKIPSGKKGTTRTVWSETLNALQLASIPVEGTYWRLIDIPDPSIFVAKRNELLKQAIWVLSLLTLFFALVSWLLKKMGVAADETKVIINAIDHERERIAMDLHDEVLSELAHLRRSCHVFHAAREITQTTSSDIEILDTEIEKITDVIRHAINDLHPQSLRLIGLEDTVKYYVSKLFNMEDSPSINIVIDHWDESRLSDNERLHLFRIIQEIFANILKHASARHCFFRMAMTETQLTFKIEDDGCGMTDNKSGAGRGKANIMIRSRLLYAVSIWKTNANNGT
ncbi:MAG: hypothetical protein V3V12_01045, partial [Gammaproteobacteria bacterium]